MVTMRRRATHMRPVLVRVVITLECLLSGFLGLYVGLDYLARTPALPRWNGGYEVVRALMAQAWPTELLQDYSGARAILFGGNAYEPAGAEAARYVQFGAMGLPEVVSTHPPTAFVLLLPLAPFTFGFASAVWTTLMLAGLVMAVRICGSPWYIAVLLGPLLALVPPVAAAVSHLAVPWLVLPLIAFRFRHRAGLAGLLIGLASLTKYLPGLLLIALLVRRQWSALGTFLLVWVIALAAIGVLNHDVLFTYLSVSGTAASPWLADSGNGSFLVAPLRFGPVAEALVVTLVVWIVGLEVRDLRAGRANDSVQWSRWNWLAVALLPITWTYSVIPLALNLVLFFQQRRTRSFILGLVGFAPLLLTFDTTSPFPQLFCTGCVGLALGLDALPSSFPVFAWRMSSVRQ
jgi:Glycosyltransferase family 87